MQEGQGNEQITKKVINAVAQRVEEQIEVMLEKSLNKLSSMVKSFVTNQKDLQELMSNIMGAAETLQKLTQELGDSAKEASATSNQLSTIMTSYKEALLSVGNRSTQESQAKAARMNIDPRLTRDLDQKQCQILLELNKEYSESKSGTNLKAKINTVLANVTPTPPEGTKVLEINKLHNRGIALQSPTKDAAGWMHEHNNIAAFIKELGTEVHVKGRVFPILIPRVPLSFDLEDKEHLREVESANNLPPRVITKAQWIKPIYRRCYDPSAGPLCM